MLMVTINQVNWPRTDFESFRMKLDVTKYKLLLGHCTLIIYRHFEARFGVREREREREREIETEKVST